ncbi:hypothetical protein DFO66_104257 [Brevibacterium sanguinis]|uniref:BFN domain-containing protein n=2 Tax=Brevibacterium TaxID=1696 RepID=A0A366IK51_9MICO|nr:MULTISPECIES: bifunctional nuclease family protein [Brevibacterium]RBP65671.1 hypothetical protein DFO66_104257 [Brevibacterium sanguinis]RBP72305.1 hypothetical protein DFO65_104263 [Brevibacterium celere]
MVQVQVLGVALDAKQQHIVLLKPLFEHLGESRVLPIWIGEQEATSILIGASGAHAPRPLSHDLMKTLLDTLDAGVAEVEVQRIDGGTFYAAITLTGPAGRHVVDARPSDAIALAVRMGAPLFVADEVLEEAGIPGSLIDESAADDEAEDELAEFKKFIEGVDPEDFRG